MDLNKAIFLFIFLFLVLNSVVINKQVIIALGLIVVGYYLYTNNKIVYKATSSSIENRLDKYRNYDDLTIKMVLEHLKEFNDLAFDLTRSSNEKMIDIKRLVMNKLFGISQSMTGSNDEHEFIELLKIIETELKKKIEINQYNNKDILLVKQGEPEPSNRFNKLDYI